MNFEFLMAVVLSYSSMHKRKDVHIIGRRSNSDISKLHYINQLVYSNMHTRLAWRRNGQRSCLLIVNFIYSSNLSPSSCLDGDLHQVMIFWLQWSHFLRWSCIEVPRPAHVALIPVTVTCADKRFKVVQSVIVYTFIQYEENTH